MTFDGRYKLAVYHSHRGLGELYDLKEDLGNLIIYGTIEISLI